MLSFRQGAGDDGAYISRLMSNWIDETHWMPWVHTNDAMAGFGPWLCEVADVTVLAVYDVFVGFYAFQDEKLQALFIESAQRGKGFGSTAVSRMKSEKSKIVLWTFQQNDGAQRFYEHHGFRELERTNGQGNDEKLPDIKYEWSRQA